MFRLTTLALALAVTGLPLRAQTFDEAAAAPAANEIKTILAGNVFNVNIADGTSWRLQFNKNGYYYINTSTGYPDDGKWRTEDGKLCVEPRRTAAACNEARVSQGLLVIKRLSGEIVVYRPK